MAGDGRRTALLAVLTACGIGLAACGGSGSHTSTRLEAAKGPSPAAVAPASTAVTTHPATGGATVGQTSAPAGHKRSATAKKTTPAASGTTNSTTATSSSSTTATSPPPTTSTKRKAPPRSRRPLHHVTSTLRATAAQSHRVLGCLAKGGLTEVSAGNGVLWSGYNGTTGTFVYVYLYRTHAAAAAQARALSAEEAAVAGRYLIRQAITPYHGSPVPVVTVCLGGKAPKQPPGKKPGSFTF